MSFLLCLNSCWISTGNGTNWAFHGPVIGVLAVSWPRGCRLILILSMVNGYCMQRFNSGIVHLQVNIVILCIVSTVIAKATRRKEDNAGLFW